MLGAMLLAGILLPQPPPTLRLDREGGVGGIRFGQSAAQIAGFARQFAGIGKRWRTTRLYRRPGNTTTPGGLGRADN